LRKLHSLPRLKEIIEAQKRKGKKIVLTNGCFDLIHVGHIRYLRDSKEKGDVLVLALNSDSSIRQLKGKGRPILKEKERVDICSSISYVDYITVFKEKTVENILRVLQPDVHAKGSDYTEETVPEKATVRSYGGGIAITGGPKVRSTSQIIEQIINRIKTKKPSEN
jgi:rfaE bifunctional protein nucleotidyltransferase chain/domain